MSRRGRDVSQGSESGKVARSAQTSGEPATLDELPGASYFAELGAAGETVEVDEDGIPIVVVPIEEAIDLHTFQPRDVLGVVDAYLDAALERGFREVRLIHGRGKGVQRANVQRSLAEDPRVERYGDAPQHRGGWGATLVWLHPRPSEPNGED